MLNAHEFVMRRVGYFRGRLTPSIDREDLYQAGMLALLRAERRYEGRNGATLETYIGNRVYGAMVDEIRSARPGTRYGLRPEMVEISDVEIESEDVSLYEHAMHHAKLEETRKAMSVLPTRLRSVIGLYYRDGFLLHEVGEVFGFGEARAYQLVKQALTMMRLAMARWIDVDQTIQEKRSG